MTPEGYATVIGTGFVILTAVGAAGMKSARRSIRMETILETVQQRSEQLTTNGGSTLADAVHRTEAAQLRMSADIVTLRERVAVVETQTEALKSDMRDTKRGVDGLVRMLPSRP